MGIPLGCAGRGSRAIRDLIPAPGHPSRVAWGAQGRGPGAGGERGARGLVMPAALTERGPSCPSQRLQPFTLLRAGLECLGRDGEPRGFHPGSYIPQIPQQWFRVWCCWFWGRCEL